MKTEGSSAFDLDEMKGKYALTNKLGPFSETGEMYSSKQLLNLYRFMWRLRNGLPYHGSHIVRSMHATGVAR